MDSIAFAAHQVNVYLSHETFVQIHGAYRLEADGRDETRDLDEGIGPTHLPVLVGRTVTEVRFERRTGDLWLTFDSGAVLGIVGDNGPCESYEIYRGSLCKVRV